MASGCDSSRVHPLTLGTAGHIDHGKTVLVRALTGVDTDRLPEERERGISIELGYAPLELPSGRRLSVVDVPGHERFVRTMVAGATGIDLYLMVVAADDGVMPQTREHAAVLAALGVSTGVVAVTKADLADPARACAEAADLLPGAEVVPVAAPSRAGLEELGEALDRAAAGAIGRRPGGALRLHVDRSFTIRGAGTVVTGTLWEGTAGRGDAVRILPSGREARIRSVQVHDEPRERAEAGQRVALNLAGVARDEVARGDVIVAEEGPAATFRIDVALQWATPEARPDGGTRVAVHHGTRETPARLTELGGRYFQLRLEQSLVPATARTATCSPASRAWSGASPSPPRSSPRRRSRGGRSRNPSHPPRSRSKGDSEPQATSRRPTRTPRCWPSCARTAASCGSGARCTSTATRSRTWRRRRGGSSSATARSRSPPCATSSARAAATPRPCSSSSTPSASRSASATSACCARSRASRTAPAPRAPYPETREELGPRIHHRPPHDRRGHDSDLELHPCFAHST
jgi:small GTP-binding protein